LDSSKTLPCALAPIVEITRRDLRAAGIDVTLARTTGQQLSELADVRVFFLDAPPARSSIQSRTLGAAPRAATSHSAVWVYWGSIRDEIGIHHDNGWLTVAECFDLAHALGHVAAHEIVHVLAPEVPHAKDGLMAETLARAELLMSIVPMDARSAEMLRAHVAMQGATERVASGDSPPAVAPEGP
jgi:hypothetical protein